MLRRVIKLDKLQQGDRVAILSPSLAAPALWPHVYELGLERLRNLFGLEPVDYPTTAKLDASNQEKATDLICAFSDPSIKAVIATLGGDSQVTYISRLPVEVFVQNPKPFFGCSDNSHLANFLFLNDIPSFYGAGLFTQFAMQGEMDAYTVKFIRHALFDKGEFELVASSTYNDVGLGWENPDNLGTRRQYEESEGWVWSEGVSSEGLLWGGCLESVDEMLRHNVPIPTLEQFGSIVMMLETSEEIPPPEYVHRVIRAFGERGVLAKIKGLLVGRPKAWSFDKPQTIEEQRAYKAKQREIIANTVRKYNSEIPIIQNMDFGHTDPQIPMPYGGKVRIDAKERSISAQF